MDMCSLFRRFRCDDEAAITVDWVVLTAGLVFLGLFVVTVVKTSIDASGTVIANNITTAVAAALS